MSANEYGVTERSALGESALGESALGDWDEEADVVIVGMGSAGSCAAIEAADVEPLLTYRIPTQSRRLGQLLQSRSVCSRGVLPIRSQDSPTTSLRHEAVRISSHLPENHRLAAVVLAHSVNLPWGTPRSSDHWTGKKCGT